MTTHPSERAAFLALVALGLTGITASARSPATRKPPRLPRAAPIILQVGDVVSVGGSTYQVGYSLIPIGAAPTPTPTPTPNPTPTPTTISGIRNRITGVLVTNVTAGTPLTLEGAGLGSGGRLQLGGRLVAQPASWTDTAILFTAPDPSPAALTGNWDLYWQVGSNWTLKASTGPFTIQPQGSPTPTPLPLPTALSLTVTGFRDAMGQLTQTFAPNSTVFINGQGFGSPAGRVQIGSVNVPVLSWTATEIQVICPPGSGPQMVTVTSADGKAYDRLKGFAISGPGGSRR